MRTIAVASFYPPVMAGSVDDAIIPAGQPQPLEENEAMFDPMTLANAYTPTEDFLRSCSKRNPNAFLDNMLSTEEEYGTIPVRFRTVVYNS